MIHTGRGQTALIVGGGVVGLSIGRGLAGAGWGVTLLDAGRPGQEASRAAAGMIAPRLEFSTGSPLLEAGLAALALYPAFVEELEDETGLSVDLRLDGIVRPILHESREPEAPPGSERISGPELRRLEPALRDDVAEAFFFPSEGSIDNRALARALRVSFEARGGVTLPETRAEELLHEGGRTLGVRARERRLEADIVVNCAGAWASQWSTGAVDSGVEPVKGQMLALDVQRGGGLPDATAPRHTIYSHLTYVVPRSDGRIIIGTTVEDRGFDKSLEAWAVQRLLTGALELCPGLRDAVFLEAWAGLRPRGPTPLPTLSAAGPEGFYLAVGHFRNGILLTPWTAARMLEVIGGVDGPQPPSQRRLPDPPAAPG